MINERIFLARHLRNLSLQMMEDSHTFCKQVDESLKPAWASLIMQLEQHGKLTVMQAAEKLAVSHVHAQKILKSMKESEIISGARDPDDGRQTFYTLTEKGRSLLPKIDKINAAIAIVLDDIAKESGEDLYSAIRAFSAVLDKESWTTRVTKQINTKEEIK